MTRKAVRVKVELPSLLRQVAGQGPFWAAGRTLGQALEDLLRRHPGLRVHLYDESGRLRRHVLCFHNGSESRWLEGRDPPLSEGDVITILQAVSGG